MKIYSVNYSHDAFMDGRMGESIRLCVTKKKAMEVFEEYKALAIENANKDNKNDPDALTISYDEEDLFVVEDEWDDWSVSIKEVEVEE